VIFIIDGFLNLKSLLSGKLIKVKISHFVRNDNQHFGFLGGLVGGFAANQAT